MSIKTFSIEQYKNNEQVQSTDAVPTSVQQGVSPSAHTTNTPSSNGYLTIEKDQEIVSSHGDVGTAESWYENMELDEQISIHCPFPGHEDRNPSAFMTKTDKESLFASCSSCGAKGFYNVNSKTQKSTSEAVEQIDVKISLFSQAVIDGLVTVGDFDPEDIIDQFLSCGIPIASFGGSLYFYIDGYWRCHDDKDQERKHFLKSALMKILGRRPRNAELNTIQKELYNEFYEFIVTSDTFVNFKNEILSISKGLIETIPHDPKYGMKYKLPYAHNPECRCPAIDAFLRDVMGDEETVIYFFQYIASSFIRNEIYKFEKALFLYGEGSNGKSVVLDLLIQLFGEINISHVSLKDILDEKKRRNMVGKIINIASEGSARALESEDFKAMVSRETLSVRSLYRDSSETNDFPRLIFATNNMPQTGGDNSKGLYRRISIIPFEKVIPESQQDRQLLSKLLPELPGMINRVIKELVDILVFGKKIVEPQRVLLANRAYILESNEVKEYSDAMQYALCSADCPIADVKTLYSDFRKFCFSAGIGRILPQREFSKRMSAIFGKQVHSNKIYGWRIYKKQ